MCSQGLHTYGFLLTSWLKVNRTFNSDQLFVISSQRQVLDSNSQQGIDDNYYFTEKERKNQEYGLFN